MLTGSQRPFKPRNSWRLGSHTFCDLGLSQPRIVASLQQQIKQSTFVALDTLNLLSNTWPLKESRYDFVMGSHF